MSGMDDEKAEKQITIISRFLNSVIRLTGLIVVVYTHQNELGNMYNKAAYMFAHDVLLFLKRKADELKSFENAYRVSKTFLNYVDHAYNALLSSVENVFGRIYRRLPIGMSQATESDVKTTINLDAYFRSMGKVAELIYDKYFLKGAGEKLQEIYEKEDERALNNLYLEYMTVG